MFPQKTLHLHHAKVTYLKQLKVADSATSELLWEEIQFMTFLSTIVGAAALIALPLASSAFTYVQAEVSGTWSATNNATMEIDPSGNEAEFSFSWSTTPYSGYITFTSDREFDLYFDNYVPIEANTRQYSGLVLVKDGNFIQNGAANSTGCNDAEFSIISGPCNLVTGRNGVGDHIKPGTGLPIFTRLALGTYTIGIDETNRPVNGSADFRVSAVPLPASSLLLVAIIFGLGWAGYRKSA